MTIIESEVQRECQSANITERDLAYLVYLVLTDLESWDARRQMSPDEARELSNRLGARLRRETRVRLERLIERRKKAA